MMCEQRYVPKAQYDALAARLEELRTAAQNVLDREAGVFHEGTGCKCAFCELRAVLKERS